MKVWEEEVGGRRTERGHWREGQAGLLKGHMEVNQQGA